MITETGSYELGKIGAPNQIQVYEHYVVKILSGRLNLERKLRLQVFPAARITSKCLPTCQKW